jgi:CBS domain-containing protein
MRITGPGKRLRIYISDGDQWQGRSLYLALLDTLKREGLAGATITRGLAGFGAHSRVHLATIETLAAELPLIIEVVDQPQRIDLALAVISPMVSEGLITVEDLQIVKYTHRYLHPIPGDKLVREVMTRDVVTVPPEMPIAEVMDLLLGREVKAVPVVDKAHHVVGIISDGDLTSRGGALAHLSAAKRLDRETLAAQLAEIHRAGKTAREVMTARVVTIRDDTALAHAATLMAEHGLKRLPVVDRGGRLTGLLSRFDVLSSLVSIQPPASIGAPMPQGSVQTVGEVMNPNVPTLPLDADLAEVVEKMVTSELKRVIVTDETGRAVGIINDGDLVERVKPEARLNLLQALRQIGRGERLPNLPAAALMTPSLLSGRADTPIAEAIERMLAEKRRRFVIVDELGRPIGIVDRQRLLRAVTGS